MINMRRICMLMCLALCLSASHDAQCQWSHGQPFSISDVRSEYCAADPDLAMVYIHVTMTFPNHGRMAMILARQLGAQEHVVVTDVTGKKVFSPNISNYGEKGEDLGEKPNDETFEIIEPGKSATRRVVIGLPISGGSARSGRVRTPGVYYVSSVPPPHDMARAAAELT